MGEVTLADLREAFGSATGNCRIYYADARVEHLIETLSQYLEQQEE